jgi:hypothetical protein
MAALTISLNGKDYPYSFSTEGDMLTVYAAGKSKSSQVGNTPPATLARMLASELIRGQ